MELYFRFLIALAAGLCGVGLVLKVLLESLFHDWDAVAELKAYMSEAGARKGVVSAKRAEDVMLEIEKEKASTFSTRLIDQRREQLRELDAVEYRLKLPSREPIVLTPIKPPPAEPEPEAVWR